MSFITILFVLAFLLIIAAFAVIWMFTERNDKQSRPPSPWQYGSGAYHAGQKLPPITRYSTSVPTGSSDPSHWADSKVKPNRPPHHPR